MKLGEMLILDGRATEEQIQHAVMVQAREGGRLGTVLVEMGVLDLDALTVYLGLELGIPIATGAALARAKRVAVRLLTPKQATHLRCIPLMVQDHQLIVAIDHPHDMQLLDELSRVTGYRIIPRVAPEIRIYYYLEYYYGVSRPKRFESFGDTPRFTNSPSQDLPSPPLPGLPPIQSHPIAAPNPPPPLRPAQDNATKQEFLEIDANELVVELEADTSATAQATREHTPIPSQQANTTEHSSFQPKEKESFRPIDPTKAIDTIQRCRERSEIASALMGYCARLFDVAAILIVRDNMAFGWKGFGPELDYDRIESLLIPLEVPSIFQTAVHDRNLFNGNIFPSTLHNYLFRVLRTTAPANATVAVIAIGSRIVNLIYGHRHDHRPLSAREIEEFQRVYTAAKDAYVRLIAVSKKTDVTDSSSHMGSVIAQQLEKLPPDTESQTESNPPGEKTDISPRQ